MENVVERTLGELIDQLITANIRCYMAQDNIMNTELNSCQRLDAAITAQKSNARRTQLIKAIDESFGTGSDALDKTYG